MDAIETLYRRYAGLLLFFAFFCTVVLYARTPLSSILRNTHRTVLRGSVFSLSVVLVSIGWAFFIREWRTISTWRRWLAFAAAIALSFSILEVGVILFAKAGMTHGLLLMYWFGLEFAVKVIAVVGTFVGSGRSRIAFVLALALACLVW